MKKMMELHYEDGKYVLKSKKGKNCEEEFTILEETLQFDTAKFYKYVFADIGEYAEVEVVNLVQEDGDNAPRDKKITKMVFETIEQICRGVSEKINEMLV